MSRCSDCEFHLSCTSNKLEGEGPGKVDIMLVGDFPSTTDDERNEVFVGDSGSKLDYLLSLAKIKRSRIHLTYAIKCKPAWGKEPKNTHIQACQKHLMQEILEVRPKVIIAAGKIALKALLNEDGITDFRGYFDDIEIEYEVRAKKGKEAQSKVFRCMVMPTFAPSSCLTKWEWDSIFLHDLQKVKAYLETGELPKKPDLKWDVCLDLPTLKQFTEKLSNAAEFSFDFETTGFSFFKDEVITAGFCIKPGQALIIPVREYLPIETKKFDKANLDMVDKINSFVSKNKSKIKQALKTIFASPARKIAHNGKFDVKFARYGGFPVKNFSFDTMIGHSLIDENKPHDLVFCMDWFGIHYGNYEIKLWPFVNKDRKKRKPYSYVPPLILSEYLAMDVDITARIKIPIKKQLKKENLWELFSKQQMPLVRLMADLEYRGIKLDVPKLQTISKDFAAILADIDRKIKKITKNPDFNPNSPKQLSEYLSEIGAIGNKGDKKTKGGGYSTDESVLARLAQIKRYAKVPRLILEARTIGKLKSNYLDGKDGNSGMLSWVDKDHMVHYTSNIHTPRTGRMSVESPAIQTIPRPNPQYPEANIRKLFITSKKDWVMYSIDFKQLEMRIAAFLSRDAVMIKEIAEGVDMHSRNAVTLATKVGMLPVDVTEKRFIEVINYMPPEGWEKFSPDKKAEVEKLRQLSLEWIELRVMVKALGFGLNYGMEASTLAKDHGRDERAMQDMIDAYFDKYEGLALWREEQKQTAVTKGVLVLPETGRKRRFTDAARWFNHEYSANIRLRETDIESVHRQAMNFPIQGYANEIFVRGKLRFYSELKRRGLKARLLLSLHDGILGEAPMSEIEQVRTLAKQCLERVLGEGKKYEVKLGVDFEVYDRWSGIKIDLSKTKVKVA